MDKKNMLVSGLAVYVVHRILDFAIHAVLLDEAYNATASLWRPEAETMSNMWIIFAVGLLWAFLFVHIYGWFHKGKGVMEGIHYGFCIGLFVAVPQALNLYAVTPMPFSLSVSWIVFDMAQIMICGAVLALVYRPRT